MRKSDVSILYDQYYSYNNLTTILLYRELVVILLYILYKTYNRFYIRSTQTIVELQLLYYYTLVQIPLWLSSVLSSLALLPSPPTVGNIISGTGTILLKSGAVRRDFPNSSTSPAEVSRRDIVRAGRSHVLTFSFFVFLFTMAPLSFFGACSCETVANN